ncbi:glycosyltransferase-like protein [Vibrio sinaloensis DSM 21326]|uniref:Glycosyltransferase-like protein n=1 Tax=Vibrio sinaloensis DSM 21326 TaxID=945550 RepID=E8M7A4_PHOS4|nr:glycosyltransferase [Vibrio sinaloensis]EGA70103.1 glycosyltransferase-like protein [Vibrio sinaloensis DSM 21326]
MKKLLYVSDSFRSLSVFESQVHTLCNKHSKQYDVTLLALCKPSEMSLPGLPDANYKLEKFKKLPKFFSMLSQKIAVMGFNQPSLFEQADIIHCRGHIGTLFTLLVCKKYRISKPVISDIRGVVPEEFQSLNIPLSSVYSKLADHVESYLFKHIEQFFFVSSNMEKHYRKKYRCETFSSEVYPTIVNDELFFQDDVKREKKRQELGYARENKVYCYVGNTASWQKLDSILTAFDNKSQKNDELRLLVVTTEPDSVREMLQDLSIKNPHITVTSSDYKNVPHFLNAADYGLLIRDDNVINRVASPTKRNEYAACGLPIITNLADIDNSNQDESLSDYKSLKEISYQQSLCYKRLIEQS